MPTPFDFKAQSPLSNALRMDDQRAAARMGKANSLTQYPIAAPPKGKVGVATTAGEDTKATTDFVNTLIRLMGNKYSGRMQVPTSEGLTSNSGGPPSGMGDKGLDNPLNQLPGEFYDNQHSPAEGPNPRMQPIYDMYKDPNRAGPYQGASLPKPQGRFLVANR